MSISAGVVLEVRTTGSDNNGGGFRGGANLTTPSAPAVSNSASGGTVAANTYFVVVTLSDGQGETPKSAETSTTTSGGASTITVTAPTNPNSQGATWNVYIGTASGGPYFRQSTGNTFGSNKVITATPPTSGTQAPGVDYSQQDAAQVDIDGSTINFTSSGATATMTLSGYVPTASDVGNLVQTLTGTNVTAGTYEITGWSSTTWTLDRNWCSGAVTTGTGNMGGGLASPGMAAKIRAPGNIVFIKSGTYTCSNSNNVSGGNINDSNGQGYYVGYNTTRSLNNADASRPTLKAGADSMTLITTSTINVPQIIANIIVDGNTHASVTAMSLGQKVRVRNCKVTGCATGIALTGSFGQAVGCEATNCTTAHFSVSNSAVGCRFVGCSAHDGGTGGVGFSIGSSTSITFASRCVAANMLTDGFAAAGDAYYENCTAYHCQHSGTANGFTSTGSAVQGTFVNCLAHSCDTGYAIGSAANVQTSWFFDCATYNCTTNFGSTVVAPAMTGTIACSVDPCNNAAGNDFSLNATANGGALLRAAGYPATWGGLSTNNYLDVGTAQTQSIVGGSPPTIVVGGGGGGGWEY